MKKLLIIALALTSFVAVESCKKKKAFKNEDGQTSEDNSNVQQQTSDAMGDADNSIANYSSLTHKVIQPPSGVLTTPCGVTVDTTGIGNGSITLNYDGVTVCNNRKRSGSIKLTIQDYASGKRWLDTGCVLQMDYSNYKVTRASDGKSLTFNGTHYVTNVVGGNFGTWLFGGTVIRTVTGTGMVVTFDDGSTATCNLSRKFTYSKSGTVYSVTGEGIGSHDGLSSLENYGTTRDGSAFTSQVTTPIVWNTTCGLWAPIQGKVDIAVAAKEFTLDVTFGVDASGNAVSVGSNACPYGWKVEWHHKNKTKNKIYQYW